MEIHPIQLKYILHWGEMGTWWGINRTVSQIHALLYLSDQPLSPEEIAAALKVARSNVSAGLKELLSWGLIRVVPKMGERKTYYESLPDVWQMFQIVLKERKRREFEPTLNFLRDCLQILQENPPENKQIKDKIYKMLQLFGATVPWLENLCKIPPEELKNLLSMGVL